MKCKLCNLSSDFGKSHVIPESFFLNSGPKDETPFVASNVSGDFPKRRPIGEYDTQILCKSCERRFAPWDDYAKKLLIDDLRSATEVKEGQILIGRAINSFDYDKLKLFFISVLWRAGVSERKFFQKVSLGSHVGKLRNHILTNNPGSKDEYSVQVGSFTGMPNDVPIIMPISLRSNYGFRLTRIYLGEVFFDIKVDSRRTPKKYSTGLIEKGKPLLIPLNNIKEMNEYKILKMIVHSPNNENAI